MHWSSLDEAQRYEKIVLTNGRLFVHGIAITLQSHVLEFAYTQSWHCRFAIDSSGAQGLVCGWQRMVHEPSYETGSYGSYGADTSDARYVSYDAAADDPSARSLDSGGGVSGQQSSDAHSRAFVTLVGMNEHGTIRLVYLSKIENVSLSLDAFKLERAEVVLHFQATKTLYEIMHVNDGAEK
ncbi:MAG TPA: hypothetical protein VM533_04575 [Fimbriiglobus sp.]|jgi:hypothetical protein|nr:hypothetical protein [Fimbriiglobus sp.]